MHSTNVQSFSETVDKLKVVDPNLIKQRGGGRDRNNNRDLFFEYLEWHTVTDILDEHAPSWTSSIKKMDVIGDFLVTTVAITIDGITREGVGIGAASTEMGIKKSEHDALKRAALKFGVGRQLYKKDRRNERINERQSRQNSDQNQPREFGPPPEKPVAEDLASMISTKQLGLVRAVAREAGVDADEVCSSVLKCKISELSRKAASWFIDFLRSPEFQAGARENVVQMPERNTQPTQSASPVSPSVAGDLLFQAGAVKPVKKGFEVTQTIGGKPVAFEITSSGDGVGCSCGDFKTQVFIKKKMDFQCAHIVAAQKYMAATNGVEASA